MREVVRDLLRLLVLAALVWGCCRVAGCDPWRPAWRERPPDQSATPW